jgi:hypothetical protein
VLESRVYKYHRPGDGNLAVAVPVKPLNATRLATMVGAGSDSTLDARIVIAPGARSTAVAITDTSVRV